jgi:hypothetical protein
MNSPLITNPYLMWLFVIGFLTFVFFLVHIMTKSQWAIKRDKKKLKEAEKWAKKNPEKVKRAKKIEDAVGSGFDFVFKIFLTLVGALILVWILGEIFGGLKALYYGSPFLFIFLMWLIFSSNTNRRV